jgi:hypothetical protein
MQHIKYYMLLALAIIATSSASAVDLTTQGLYRYQFKTHQNAGGVEATYSTNLFGDMLGQTSASLSQGVAVENKHSDVLGLTSLGFRQNLDRLTVFGLQPYIEGKGSLVYGQGQQPQWFVSPVVGEEYKLGNANLFASVGYDFGMTSRTDSLTARLGVRFTF